MDWLNLNQKRVLFVFGDPAGAKAMMAFYKQQKALLKEGLLLGDRDHTFTGDMGVEPKIVRSRQALQKTIQDFKPDVLVAGTSTPAGIEVESTVYCQKNFSVLTVAFVDHWTNMLNRFAKNGEIQLPDFVWVIDEKAAAVALEEGIPKTKIRICPNPYYEYLKEWKPVLSREEICGSIKCNPELPYILYAPEPLLKFNLREQYGFDEYDCLEDLMALVGEKYEDKITVVFKIHPNENKESVQSKIANLVGPVPENFILTADADINHLAYYSKAVLGMFSNSLLESQLLGASVYRLLHRMNNVHSDPFQGKQIGKEINDSEAFGKMMNELLEHD